MCWANRKRVVKLAETGFRFAVVGIVTAVLYYCLLLLGVELLSLPPALASSICYLIVVAFNYLMHYSWTFVEPAPHGTALRRYMVMTTCGFLINAAVMYCGIRWLDLHYLFTQSMALVLVVSWNFVVSNVWVFRR